MENSSNNIVLQLKNAGDIFYHFVIPLSSKRLLNPDVEQVIVEEAESLSPDTDINLVLRITGDQVYNDNEIASAIKRHFEYQHDRARKEIATTFRLGWKSLIIAFIFLIAMYFLSSVADYWLPNNGCFITLRELFMVLGWVALWRPAELLLYDWRPHKRKARLCDRISKCNLQIVREKTNS